MMHTEFIRRNHLSKDVNGLVSAMIAVSDISEDKLTFINDNLSYFKRNLQDMSFHKFSNEHELYEVYLFSNELYDLVEKYEISKKVKLPLDKFDLFLDTLHRIMKLSLQMQYSIDNLEKRRVQIEAFANMK